MFKQIITRYKSSEIPFQIEAGDCFCSETKSCGYIEISEEDAKNHPEWMCDSGSMSWDLTIEKEVAFNVGYGAGKSLREIEAFEMYWHAEGMKTKFQCKELEDKIEWKIVQITPVVSTVSMKSR